MTGPKFMIATIYPDYGEIGSGILLCLVALMDALMSLSAAKVQRPKYWPLYWGTRQVPMSKFAQWLIPLGFFGAGVEQFIRGFYDLRTNTIIATGSFLVGAAIVICWFRDKRRGKSCVHHAV